MTDAKTTVSKEQEARRLLAEKDIAPGTMKAVQTLLDNNDIGDEERYQAVIDLIQSSPNKKRSSRQQGSTVPRELFGPTETSYYVDGIRRQYRHLRLFKKKWLVKRDNRFGFGFRKRLIPSKTLLSFFNALAQLQERMLDPLTDVFQALLEDDEFDDTRTFNYLRAIRRWLMKAPFIDIDFDRLKMQERYHFERQLKDYVITFLSFQKLSLEVRESILLTLERGLRNMENLCRLEIDETLDEPERRRREKENFKRESYIFRYLLDMRQFLSMDTAEQGNMEKLFRRYGANSFESMLIITMEALAFQKKIKKTDLFLYYEIGEPIIRTESWDYSEELVRKAGKDPDSKRQKHLDELKNKLEELEYRYAFLKHTGPDGNILVRAVEDQWRIVDKKRYDPKSIYRENFISFIDALLHYFNRVYLPILSGSAIFLKKGKDSLVETALFSEGYMASHVREFQEILDEMHFFKGNNPTMMLTHEEVGKIMRHSIKSMGYVERILNSIGYFFYNIGNELIYCLQSHAAWREGGMEEDSAYTKPISFNEKESIQNENSRVFPYYDTTFHAFSDEDPMQTLLRGKVLLADNENEGILIDMVAYCLQSSLECFNSSILEEVGKRKKISGEIARLEKVVKKK